MEIIINFIEKNYTWLFSGLGIAVISYIFFQNKSGQNQKVDNNSSAYQAGRDINTNAPENKSQNIKSKNAKQ